MADTIRTRADMISNLFQDGQAASSITEQDIRDLISSLVLRGGWADYNDATTAGAPIVVTGGAGFVYLTNDAAGPFTNKNWRSPDITDVWDASLNQFDWSELDLLDDVTIRLDATVTTASPNQELEIALEVASGASSYDIPFVIAQVKNAGDYRSTRFNGLYMGDANTLNNPSKFKIKSDGNCTVVVHGWWCKVTKD